MLYIVLDTNILHQEGMNSGKMQVLKTLVKANHVQICVPDIVEMEYKTKRIDNLTDRLTKIEENYDAIYKEISFDKKLASEFSSIREKVTEQKKEISESIEKSYATWFSEYNVRRLQFRYEEMKCVLDGYFSGGGVYRTKKCRDDIPDAIIKTTIDDLINEVGNIIVVIKDGVFTNAIRSNDFITVCNGLDDVMNLEYVVPFLENINKYSNIKDFIANERFLEIFESYIKNNDVLDDVYIDDGGVDSDAINIWHYGATLGYLCEDDISRFTIQNIYSLGDGRFTADITFESSAGVSYVTDYSSFMSIKRDKARDIECDSMNGDGMCDLSEDFHAKFRGNVIFILKNEIIQQDELIFDNVFENIFNVEINIEWAELLQPI